MTETVKVEKNGVVKSVQKSALGLYITAGWKECAASSKAGGHATPGIGINIRK